MEINKIKALYIKIKPEIHCEVKRLAAFKYTTMENWVREAIIEKLTREKSYLKDNLIP